MSSAAQLRSKRFLALALAPPGRGWDASPTRTAFHGFQFCCLPTGWASQLWKVAFHGSLDHSKSKAPMEALREPAHQRFQKHQACWPKRNSPINEMQTTSTCLSRRALPAGENIMAGDTADKLSLLKKLLQQTKALSFSQQPIAPMLDSKSSAADPRTPTQLTLDRRTKALFGRVPSGNVELAWFLL